MSCLSHDQLVAFVDGSADGETREAMIEHLSRCAECRRGLIEASSLDLSSAERSEVSPTLLETARQLGRRRPEPRVASWAWAAAAILVVAVGVGTVSLGPGEETPVLVGEGIRSSVEGGGPFEALEPMPGSVFATEPILLRWTDLPDARRYDLTVVDELGNILVRQATSEPSWSLDPSAPELATATATLFWYVEAELEDRTVRETAPRELRRSP